MNYDFAHIVVIDKSTRTLRIERLYPDGRRELFTATNIPLPSGKSEDLVSKFALQLGENILLDSPAARELLGL
jgi:hypothetical protein